LRGERAGFCATGADELAQVVIVNPDASEIDDQAHHVLRGTAATLLPGLLEGF